MFRGRYLSDQLSARLRLRRLRRARFADRLLRGCATRSLLAKRGGARRDRTDDLMLAKHALSQLSYGPVGLIHARLRLTRLRRAPRVVFVLRGCATRSRRRSVVGLGRLELPTSRLSSARSNQLSYKPLTRGACSRTPALSPTHRTSAALARVRPRRKRNEDGEIPPMQLNDPDDRWPLMFQKRLDRRQLLRAAFLKNHP